MVRVKWASDLESVVLHYWTVVVLKVKAWYERFLRTICPPEEYGTANGTARTLGFKLPVCNILGSPPPVVAVTATTYETLSYTAPEVTFAVFPPWTMMIYFGFFMLAMVIGYAVLAAILVNLWRRTKRDGQQALHLIRDMAYEKVNAMVDAKLLNPSSMPHGAAAKSDPQHSSSENTKGLPDVILEQVKECVKSEVDNSVAGAVESKWTSVEQSLISRVADKVQTMVNDALTSQVAGAVELKWTSAEQSLVSKSADRLQTMIANTLPLQVRKIADEACETLMDRKSGQLKLDIQKSTISRVDSLASRLDREITALNNTSLQLSDKIRECTEATEKNLTQEIDALKHRDSETRHTFETLSQDLKALDLRYNQLAADVEERADAPNSSGPEISSLLQRLANLQAGYIKLGNTLEKEQNHRREIQARYGLRQFRRRSPPKFPTPNMEEKARKRSRSVARMGLSAQDIAFRSRFDQGTSLRKMLPDGKRLRATHYPYGDYLFPKNDKAELRPSSPSLHRNRRRRGGQRKNPNVTESLQSGGNRDTRSITSQKDAQRPPKVSQNSKLSTPEDLIDQIRWSISYPSRAVGADNFIRDLKKWQDYAASMTGQLQEKETHQLAMQLEPTIDLRKAPNMASLRRELASRETKEVKSAQADANVDPEVERTRQDESAAAHTNPETATNNDSASLRNDTVPKPPTNNKTRAPLVPQLPLQGRSSFIPRPPPPPPPPQQQTIVSKYAAETDTPSTGVPPKPEAATPTANPRPGPKLVFKPAIDSKWASAPVTDDGGQGKPRNDSPGNKWRGGQNRGRRGWGL